MDDDEGPATTDPRKVEYRECRFYEPEFPEKGEVVMAKVMRIGDMGAYVQLLEYQNKEGMILMSELSKRRFRSVNKLLKVGRHEVVMVMRVDESKGYVDLSKRRVSPEDVIACEDRYSAAKKLHQTARHVAGLHKVAAEMLKEKVIWPLFKSLGHPSAALKELATKAEDVFRNLDLDEDIKACFISEIHMRLAPQPLKVRAQVDTWCFGEAGVTAVTAALATAKGHSDVEVVVSLKAPPSYILSCQCFDKELGMKAVGSAVERISAKIHEFAGGDCKLRGQIMCLGGDEEKQLEAPQEEESDSESESESEDEGMGVAEDVAAHLGGPGVPSGGEA